MRTTNGRSTVSIDLRPRDLALALAPLGLLLTAGEALAGGGAAFASGITTLTGWIGGDLGETLFFGALIVGGISAALFRAWGVMAGVFALGLLMVVAGPVSAALFGATLPVPPTPAS